MTSITDRAGLPPARLTELTEQLADHTTLERVVRWGLMRGHLIADVISQDEYTQDVVLPLGESVFLVYDAT